MTQVIFRWTPYHIDWYYPPEMLLGVDRVRNLASGSKDPTRDKLGEAVAQGVIFIDERC